MGALGLYGEVFRRMRPHLGRLLFAVAAVAVSSALEILKPWPLKIVLDNVLRGVPLKNAWLAPLSPSSLLLVSCIGLVVLYTAIALFNVTNNYVTISIGQRPYRPPRHKRSRQGEQTLYRRPSGARFDPCRTGVHARGRVIPRIRAIEQREPRRDAQALHLSNDLRRRGQYHDRARHRAGHLHRRAARTPRHPHDRRPDRFHLLPGFALCAGEPNLPDLRPGRGRQGRTQAMSRSAGYRTRN